VLDEGVSFGKVVLDDHALLIGEREIDGLDFLEVRGLYHLRLA
jgi:hypothetical protein